MSYNEWMNNDMFPRIIFCLSFTHSAIPQEFTYREVYHDFQPSYDIFRRSSAKDGLDRRFCGPPAYTANSASTQSQQPV